MFHLTSSKFRTRDLWKIMKYLVKPRLDVVLWNAARLHLNDAI